MPIIKNQTLREKCRNTEFFLVLIFLYSVRIQEIQTRKNSVFEHFLRSEVFSEIQHILFQDKMRKI